MSDQSNNLANQVPASPLRSSNAAVRAAWQAALYIIRSKNRAAQFNGGERVSLVNPPDSPDIGVN